MEDQEFINQLAEKLSKLGTVRPLGFHYLHPYGTAPADSIICNGATYSRALYKDFFDYITTQGWVKTEAEWQEIATRDNGFCPFYSSGDGSTNFRTPKFAPYQQIALASGSVGKYHQAGLPNITGYWNTRGPEILENPAGGAFIIEKSSDNYGLGHNEGNPSPTLKFDASRSSSVYGRSSTVQPESHEWVVCVVAYGIATNVGSVDIQNVMSATAQVQAEIAGIQQTIGNITKFAAPDYGSSSTIAANNLSSLTTEEITAVKQFANANSVEVPSTDKVSIDKHNNDPEAHHDIRVALSTLNEYAHKVASVWSTEVDLVDMNKASFALPWDYVMQDITNCTDSATSANWVAPANEAYDVTVKVGFSGLPTGLSATLTLKKNGAETVATETFTNVTNVITLNKDQVILSERDKLSCTITFNKIPSSGIITPARSYLRVDNHGSVLAKRASDFIFNTLANMIFYEGIEARLQLDEAKKPAVVIDTWNAK